jgi:tRNA (guanine6-N2)-methyltransferase
MLYMIQTIPGLGKLAWQEVEIRLADTENPPKSPATLLLPGRNDLILVALKGNPRELLRLRMSEDVFAVAGRVRNIAPDDRGLRQIHAGLRQSHDAAESLRTWQRLRGARRPATSFRVIAREAGSHRYQRRDIAQAVADAIRDGWPGKLRRAGEDADLEIWATLIDRELICGIRLSGPEMRQREKLRHVPASLRPALAAAMVWLSDPQEDDVFLDPMAGAGTLLLERAAAGPFAVMHGGDRSAAAVEALRVNTRPLRGEIRTARWDARKLPFDDGGIDKIAVNMPFGHQIEPGENLPDLYRELLAEFARVLHPGGRLVALVGSSDDLDQARAGTRHWRAAGRMRVTILGRPAVVVTYDRT